jgi:ADP-ribose pyrophosphatase YjhB (NUDIX family)
VKRTTAGVLLYRFRKNSIQVLLVHNGRTWSIPKGSVKLAETTRKAAKRELKEETCLKAPPGLIDLGSVVKRTGRGERLHCFLGEYTDKKAPKPAREIRKANFVLLATAARVIEEFQAPLLLSLLTVQQLRRIAGKRKLELDSKLRAKLKAKVKPKQKLRAKIKKLVRR